MGIEADGYNIIYENYKDPLKPIEKTKGFGYYGTLAMTEDKKYVQCHVCGKLFASLSGHIRQHNLTGKEYKEHFQLMTSTALVSEEVREIRIKNSLKLSTKTGYTELPIHLAEYNRKVQSGEIKHKGSNSWKLERRNKEGICPDQVLEKIKDLEEILGRTPTLEEFRSHYHNRYIKAIQYQHGSYLKAVAKAGLRSAYSLRHPDKESLVSELRAFYERYGRVPMTSDFKREMLRDRGVYIRAFGSLNNARVEAGLDAILPLPFGQKVILSPDEYLKYKETGKTPHYTPSKMAIRKRKARQKHLTPNNY
jgi:hypothetical protein